MIVSHVATTLTAFGAGGHPAFFSRSRTRYAKPPAEDSRFQFGRGIFAATMHHPLDRRWGTARAAEEKNISDIGSVTPVQCPDSSPWRQPITELRIARDRVRGDVGERLVEAAYWRRIVRCRARVAIRM
ncbi:hypothetical protein B0H14DRAFT_3871169 [Mycena olivaceomarginata]|nr:hypothetical protein B0H14DRAFT_3871169 [Mycena olivaceomarginata]